MMWSSRSTTSFCILFNLLCLALFFNLLPLHSAIPVAAPEVLGPVPVPEDVISDDSTRSDSIDDSSIQSDLSDFTEAELIHLAKLLQNKLEEDSPASSPPRIEFPVSFKAEGPVWVVPIDQLQEENDDFFPRDRRSFTEGEDEDNTPIMKLGQEDQESPSVSVVVVAENPRITCNEELMEAGLNAEQVDEIELRQRLDELGDFLKERAWTTNNT